MDFSKAFEDQDVTMAMDGEFADIPMSNEDMGVSLPTPEELRSSIHMARGGGSGSRSGRKMLWSFFAVVLLLTLVIGVSVGVAGGDNGSQQQNGAVGAVGDTNFGSTGGTATPTDPSASPGGSVVVTSTRQSSFSGIVVYMEENSVSTFEAMATAGTPQYLAVNWLANQDVANLAVPTLTINSVVGYRYMFRYVLAVVYFSTEGYEWTGQLSFMTGRDICGWNKVFTNGFQNFLRGVVCTGDTGLPWALILDNNNLNGVLPPEIGMLRTLQNFSVNRNSLGGGLPDRMCFMLQLIVFEARDNMLTGEIPACIGQLSKSLTFLWLANNAMSGQLPASIAALTKLKELVVDDNLFTGDVTGLFNGLFQLETLFLEGNGFTGTLTESFLAGMQKLALVDLSTNRFEGSIPLHFFTAMPALLLLDLHDNELTGVIPAIPIENTMLRFLSIHNNQIRGQIPASIANLQGLAHLDVASNILTGLMPGEAIGSLANLAYFFASANLFTPGGIPSAFANLVNLEELGLKGTRRFGSIPSFLGDLTKLVFLDLDDNSLVGPLPAELSKLSDLEFLLLNRNDLSGEIPVEFAALTSLRVAFFENNNLFGSLAPLCSLSTFNEPLGDVDGRELLIHDCLIEGTNTGVVCECCTSCCSPQDPNCNPYTAIPNLDPIWEYLYDRFEFTFGNEAVYIAQDYLGLPPGI